MNYKWVNVMPESERAIYAKAFSDSVVFGEKPALLVIDCTYAFTGTTANSVDQAIEEIPTACGNMAWESLHYIKKILTLFRSNKFPVIFTKSDFEGQLKVGKATKSKRPVVPTPFFNTFPDIIQPNENDWVMKKTKASAFFSTPLVAFLYKQKIDTIVICGVSTSGCVRATVTDAFSFGFPTFVVEEGCFDRSYFAHCTNLFDMNAKYASVISFKELEKKLSR